MENEEKFESNERKGKPPISSWSLHDKISMFLADRLYKFETMSVSFQTWTISTNPITTDVITFLSQFISTIESCYENIKMYLYDSDKKPFEHCIKIVRKQIVLVNEKKIKNFEDEFYISMDYLIKNLRVLTMKANCWLQTDFNARKPKKMF